MKKKLTAKEKDHIKEMHKCASLLVKSLDVMVKLKEESTSGYREIANINTAIKLSSGSLQSLEYAMQTAWGFKPDSKKHTWWLKPERCTCPKSDNLDPVYYGSGAIVNADCPIHGDIYHDIIKLRDIENMGVGTRVMVIILNHPSWESHVRLSGWFSGGRIPKDKVPSWAHKLSLRHTDDDDSIPATAEASVGVNFFGDFVYEGDPIVYPAEDNYVNVVDWWFENE